MFKEAKIKKITDVSSKSGNLRLYNIAVKDDESYIVEGLVSHNCRCTVMSFIEEDQGLIDESLGTNEESEE